MADSPTDPQMVVLTPRRGRPPADVKRTTLCTWVETAHYDQIVKIANQQEKSVSAIVRELIVLRLK